MAAKDGFLSKYVAGLMRAIAVIIGLVCVVMPLQSLAQEAITPADTALDQVEVDPETFVAPVVVDGETLFLVRGSSALPAHERAEKIVERVIAMAELPHFVPIEFTTLENELGLAIIANGRMMTITTLADAEYEQIDLKVLAALHAEAIDAAIDSYRLGRSDEARVDSALVAVGWTIGFLLLTGLFARRREKLVHAAETITTKRFVQVEEATSSVVKGNAIARLVGFVTNLVLWVIYLIALYFYLSFVLLSFTETRPIAQLLLTYVSEPMVDVMLGFVAFLPNFITLTIIVILTKYLVNGLRLFMDNVEAGTFRLANFEPHWITPTFNIGRVLIVAVAVVFAYPHIPGSDSKAFQGLTILAGIMVSLGSNTVVSNMMAGLFVIYRRSTNIGDRIKVGEQVGDVIEIKLMETLIKSIKNEMISIPNAQLLNSEVINYSRKIDGRGLLVHTTVGIGYEEPQEKIKAMLVEAANRTSSLRKSPDPFVLCTSLADYAINYQVNAFTTRGSLLPKILSDLHFNIIDVFNENNVQIMTPSYMVDPEEMKIPKEEWDGQLALRKEPHKT